MSPRANRVIGGVQLDRDLFNPIRLDLGCNPTNLPTDTSVKTQVTATDNCGTPTVYVSHTDGGTVCAPTRTFTISAVSGCNNTSTAPAALSLTGLP